VRLSGATQRFTIAQGVASLVNPLARQMVNGRTLILTAWTALWVGGVGYYLYSRNEAQLESQRAVAATAINAAAEKERESAEETQRLEAKLKVQAQRMAALQLAKGFGGTLTPEEETSPVSGLLGTRPQATADHPIPPVIPAAEKFISGNTLTATSIDTTPYCVINKQRYRVGDYIAVGPDLMIRVAAIKDGFVIFSGDRYKFKMHLILAP
jgi:hypothetical protein